MLIRKVAALIILVCSFNLSARDHVSMARIVSRDKKRSNEGEQRRLITPRFPNVKAKWRTFTRRLLGDVPSRRKLSRNKE